MTTAAQPPAMFHLVYTSTAVAPFSGFELLAGLALYRAKNLRLGITGLLLYKQGEFMQALEGEEATVRSLFATIRDDPRHQHVHLLVGLEVPKRYFPRWSMGFNNLDETETSAVPDYTPRPDLPAAHKCGDWKNSIAMRMLASFMHEY